jgi:hypothetical protein
MVDKATVIRTYANVREDPDQRSELFSQALLGDEVEVREDRGKWLLCKLFCGGQGWIQRGSILSGPSNAAYFSEGELLVCSVPHARVVSEPAPKGTPLIVVTDGTVLPTKGLKRHWYSALLPDGTDGWIWHKYMMPLSSIPKLTGSALVDKALAFCGIPYLWGGTTSLGLDCSGLVQLVYRYFGVVLPRNSSQQAERGDPLSSADSFEKLLPGDLLFFAEKDTVDHVAISLGGMSIIHASMGRGQTQVDSLDPSSPEFNKVLREHLHSARRIITS